MIASIQIKVDAGSPFLFLPPSPMKQRTSPGQLGQHRCKVISLRGDPKQKAPTVYEPGGQEGGKKGKAKSGKQSDWGKVSSGFPWGKVSSSFPFLLHEGGFD